MLCSRPGILESSTERRIAVQGREHNVPYPLEVTCLLGRNIQLLSDELSVWDGNCLPYELRPSSVLRLGSVLGRVSALPSYPTDGSSQSSSQHRSLDLEHLAPHLSREGFVVCLNVLRPTTFVEPSDWMCLALTHLLP